MRLLNILLVISFSGMAAFLCRGSSEKIYLILSCFIALIFGFLIIKFLYKDMFRKISVSKILLSFVVTIYSGNVFYSYHFGEFSEYYKLSSFNLFISSVLFILAFTSLTYYFIEKIWPYIFNFFKSLSKNEKRYIVGLFIFAFIITTIVYNLTNAFYSAGFYDIIYTSDSGEIFAKDTFFNVSSSQNDMPRQPLFGVFSLPFALISKVLSNVLFFVPNSYPICTTVIQIVLLGIISIMICRIFNLKKQHERNFIMIYMSSFMVISFAFIIEQYIISLFYLILVLYVYYVLKNKNNYAYIGSVGSLTTSVAFLPFVTSEKDVKSYIGATLKCLLIGIGIFAIFGQIPLIFNFVDSLVNIFNSFGGDSVPFKGRIIQWISFIRNIFVTAPASLYPGRFSEYGYYLDDIYNISKFGILILIICLISLILNRKNKQIKVLLGWILYSFLILVILGWGTSENGLNLYSLYFGWPFVVLIYMFLNKVFKNSEVLNIMIYIITICLLVINVLGFLNIVDFGLTYYPIN